MSKMGGILSKTVKFVFWIGLIWVVIFFVAKGLSRKPPEKKIMPKVVKAVKAEQKDADIFIESFGNLYSPYNVDIKAQVTGEVTEVHFKDGDIVKKGAMLFTIDPSIYKATLKKTQAQLAQDTASLKLRKDTLERNRSLLAKDLISQQDFDKYETDVAVTEAMIKLDKAEIELAKINLGYCYIISPIDGVCGKRQVDPGNIVTANTGPTLVNIKTIDPLYIDFTIPERDLDKVRDAMSKRQLKVKIIVEKQERQGELQQQTQGDPAGTYEGDLHFLDNSVDNMTGTVLLRAVIANHEIKLWAGQFVRVQLNISRKENAIIIPYEAIQTGQERDTLFYYVFVVTPENKAQLRKITIGSKLDDHNIVESGIKADELVVTSGQMGLRDGAEVEIKQ